MPTFKASSTIVMENGVFQADYCRHTTRRGLLSLAGEYCPELPGLAVVPAWATFKRYADSFVVMCNNRAQAEKALTLVRSYSRKRTEAQSEPGENAHREHRRRL